MTPTTTGSTSSCEYILRCRMEKEDEKAFGESQKTNITVSTPTPLPYDAKIVGNTIPDEMIVGQSYNVSISIQNTGQNSWSGNTIALCPINQTKSFPSVEKQYLNNNEIIAPGGTKVFNFTMKCDTKGRYYDDWQMNVNNTPFGETLYDDVLVKEIIPTSITLNYDFHTMYLDDPPFQLVAKIYPENATDKTIDWGSTNEDVATVSATGLVTPKSVGSTSIKAIANGGTGIRAECRITVIEFEGVTGVSLNTTSITKKPNDIPFQLFATVSPESASNKRVKWTSSDTTVATVDANGMVNPLKIGAATITATSVQNTSAKATCKLTVASTVVNTPTVGTSIATNVGQSNATINGALISDGTSMTDYGFYTGTSSTPTTPHSLGRSVAQFATFSMDLSGLLPSTTYYYRAYVTNPAGTGLGSIMSFTTSSGQSLKIPVTSVSLNKTSTTLTVGGSPTILTATVSPTNATDKTVTWSTNKQAVATVDSAGVVTPKGVGTCIITAKANDGSGKYGQCTVTVTAAPVVVPVTSITLNKTTLPLTVGGSKAALTATILPTNSSNKTVTWSTDKQAVATVDSTGVVTPKGVGTCIITAKAKDGSGKYSQCSVTVTAPVAVTRVTFNKTSLNLTAGGSTATLTVTVLPADASDKTVTWSADRPEVATVEGVDNSGIVTPVGVGTCTIKASAGSRSCTLNVKVVAPVPVTSITLNKSALTLTAGGSTETLTAVVSPSDASNKTVTWSTNSHAVATVDSSGVVTPVGVGNCIITAMANDGSGKYGQCSVASATTVPTVSSYSPVDGATGVEVGANLVLTFNQNVTAVAGKYIYIKKTTDNTLVGSILANDTTKVSITSNKVTINPSSNLGYSTGYYILIDAGAFKNTSNVNYAGISSTSTWNFYTQDVNPQEHCFGVNHPYMTWTDHDHPYPSYHFVEALDTKSHVSDIHNGLDSYGYYNPNTYTNNPALTVTNAMGKDAIFYIDSHGGAGHVCCPYQDETGAWKMSLLTGTNTANDTNIPIVSLIDKYGNTTNKLKQVRFAYFGSCHSAVDATPSEGWGNLLQSCTDLGVDCSLGFTDTIRTESQGCDRLR